MQAVIEYPGTLANLYVVVGSNTANGTTTIKSRKNGADGNLSISIPASTGGTYEDVTHSDSFSASDKGNYSIVVGGTSGAISLWVISTTMQQTGSTLDSLYMATFDLMTGTTTNHTRYSGVMGNLSFDGNNGNSNEANVKWTVRYAGTWKNLRGYVSANTVSVTATVNARIGAAAGNQTIAWATTVTGTKVDSTHTDSLSAGSVIDLQIVVPAGTGSLNIPAVQSYIETTNGAYSFFASDDTGDLALATTTYWPIGGGTPATSGTEANVQLKIRGVALTASNLYVNISSNSAGVTTTISTRVNGSTGALSVSVPSNTGGVFEDNTHSETWNVGDLVNLLGSNTATSIVMNGLGVQVTQSLSSPVTGSESVAESSSTKFSQKDLGSGHVAELASSKFSQKDLGAEHITESSSTRFSQADRGAESLAEASSAKFSQHPLGAEHITEASAVKFSQKPLGSEHVSETGTARFSQVDKGTESLAELSSTRLSQVDKGVESVAESSSTRFSQKPSGTEHITEAGTISTGAQLAGAEHIAESPTTKFSQKPLGAESISELGSAKVSELASGAEHLAEEASATRFSQAPKGAESIAESPTAKYSQKPLGAEHIGEVGGLGGGTQVVRGAESLAESAPSIRVSETPHALGTITETPQARFSQTVRRPAGLAETQTTVAINPIFRTATLGETASLTFIASIGVMIWELLAQEALSMTLEASEGGMILSCEEV